MCIQQPTARNMRKKDTGVPKEAAAAAAASIEQELAARDAMDEIRAFARQEHLFRPTWKTQAYTLADGIGWFLVAFYLAYQGDYAPWVVAGMWGYAVARCGFCMHMIIHQAIFRKYQHSRTFAIITMNFLIGTSWRWWRDMHNKHHQHTNVTNADPDLRTSPMVVYNEKLATGELTQWQRCLLPVYMALVIPAWRYASVRKCLRMGWYSDIGWAVLHWIAVVLLFSWSRYTSGQAVFMCLMADTVAGYYLFSVFMTNHVLEDVIDEKDHGMSLMMHTLCTTRNLMFTKDDPLSWSNWCLWYITGGLNLQIEHHLFPSCPVDMLPFVAVHVQQAVTKRGLHYRAETPSRTFVQLWRQLAVIEGISRSGTKQRDFSR